MSVLLNRCSIHGVAREFPCFELQFLEEAGEWMECCGRGHRLALDDVDGEASSVKDCERKL